MRRRTANPDWSNRALATGHAIGRPSFRKSRNMLFPRDFCADSADSGVRRKVAAAPGTPIDSLSGDLDLTLASGLEIPIFPANPRIVVRSK
jgi:hypothetical protein